MRRYRQPPPPPRSTGGLIRRRSSAGSCSRSLVVASASPAGSTSTGTSARARSARIRRRSKNAHRRTRDRVADPSPRPRSSSATTSARARRRSARGLAVRHDHARPRRPAADTLSLLSFPRDLHVPIYCKARTSRVTIDRINSAWSTCGAQGTLDTVQKLTGDSGQLPDHRQFPRLQAAREQARRRLHDGRPSLHQHAGGPGGYATIDLHPGYQKLDGQQALDFVRFRHTDSDVYRLARQQLFLEALKDRVCESGSRSPRSRS